MPIYAWLMNGWFSQSPLPNYKDFFLEVQSISEPLVCINGWQGVSGHTSS